MKKIEMSLAAARVNAKMTQEEVARALKVSNKTVVNWESGRTEPTYATLCMLSQIYDIPVDNIFLPSKSTLSGTRSNSGSTKTT